MKVKENKRLVELGKMVSKNLPLEVSVPDPAQLKQNELEQQSNDANMRKFIKDNLQISIFMEDVAGEPHLTIELVFKDQVNKDDFIARHQIPFKELSKFIIP